MGSAGRLEERMTRSPQPFPLTALDRAQNLIYEAWETPAVRDQISLAKEALATSDRCADAHVLLAELSVKGPAEALRHYERGVAAGESAIGRENFEAETGYFWSVLSTRPYMRAREGLARCLWSLGERERAIAHLQEMLCLNPNDNQGVRFDLASWLFAVEDHEALQVLLYAQADEVSAAWGYARTLVALRKGNEPAAQVALEDAWNRNRHVPALILGTGHVPRRRPESYRFGSREEACAYVASDGEHWTKPPTAKDWLAAETNRLAATTQQRL